MTERAVGQPYPLKVPPLSTAERGAADALMWELRNGQTADCANPGAHRPHQRIIHDAVTGDEHLHCTLCLGEPNDGHRQEANVVVTSA